MLRELISTKINEIFAEYQEANNIISGDIDPEDALELDDLEEALEEIIEKICSKQPKAINYDDFTPSWYIYADHEGNVYAKHFGNVDEDFFFTNVSRKICYDDIDDTYVVKIFHKGKEVFYAGWQPRMKYEYTDEKGSTVWAGYFEEWDH